MLQAAGEYMSGFAHLFATHHAACKQTGLLLSHLACIAQSVFCRLQWHFFVNLFHAIYMPTAIKNNASTNTSLI